MTLPPPMANGPTESTATVSPGADHLLAGCRHQLEGRWAEALSSFAVAIDRARQEADRRTLAEALRRFAVLHQQQGESDAARRYATESHDLAAAEGHADLTAEALNTLAGIAFEAGDLDAASSTYQEARETGYSNPGLLARIDQNLGNIASIRGDQPAAELHYRRALAGHEEAGDHRSAAQVHHNLGLLEADRERWEEAHRHYSRASYLAGRVGDVHLEALCALNRAELHLALEQFGEARQLAERALATFDRTNSVADKPDAYRVLGMVFHATGLPTLAESRLRTAISCAAAGGSPLSEAEAWRGLSELQADQGNVPQARTSLARARHLFQALGACNDVKDVDARRQALPRWVRRSGGGTPPVCERRRRRPSRR
jgi:tetratricopeptide (TPR) repeat protein